MTSLEDAVLSRPAPAPDAGPLDETLYDLVEARFRRLLRTHPPLGILYGIHTEDHRLTDGSRDAVLQEIGEEHAHLAAIEALDDAGLSPTARFERDLEVHGLRRVLFDLEETRTWERRSTALDAFGDTLFLAFARDFAPLDGRLDAMASRFEALPEHLAQHRTRARGPQTRLWQRIEIEAAADLPGFIDEIVSAGPSAGLAAPDQRRLAEAAAIAKTAIASYSEWLETTLADGTDAWAIGRDAYEELVRLREFDGLDVDAILEIGLEQLARNKEARLATAREIDPTADERVVVARVKEDHPPTFDAALDGYRDAMFRARRHLIERDLVTVPDDERLEVVPTPVYLRKLVPFAAYFDPPKFDPRPSGLYIVTPSVHGEAGAMREHNWSAISNTSIHEAYPGHHLQLAVGTRHPSLTRLLVEGPEFTEGWGMYSEQMMREEGFDDGPSFRVSLYTDAIWRACRIILDVRMHRGEIDVDDAIAFLIEQTGFEPANAEAEVHRYTYTPTYQLSYLLGKVMLLGLREDERRRRGDGFRLKDFHDSLLRAGSIPVTFHRRLLEDAADGRTIASGVA